MPYNPSSLADALRKAQAKRGNLLNSGPANIGNVAIAANRAGPNAPNKQSGATNTGNNPKNGSGGGSHNQAAKQSNSVAGGPVNSSGAIGTGIWKGSSLEHID